MRIKKGTGTKRELVTYRLIYSSYNKLVTVTFSLSIGSGRCRGTQMLKQLIESIIREDTTEQLDSAFDEITGPISLRSAQGLGTDEGLNEMLAAITVERNTRLSSG